PRRTRIGTPPRGTTAPRLAPGERKTLEPIAAVGSQQACGRQVALAGCGKNRGTDGTVHCTRRYLADPGMVGRDSFVCLRLLPLATRLEYRLDWTGPGESWGNMSNPGAVLHRCVLAGIGFVLVGQCAYAAASEDSRIPFFFEENRGQIDPQYRYLARSAGFSLLLSSRELVLAFSHGGGPLRMQLEGANSRVQIEPLDRLDARKNYFIGSDPGKWVRDAPLPPRAAAECLSRDRPCLSRAGTAVRERFCGGA